MRERRSATPTPGGLAMNRVARIDRRFFVAGSTAAAGLAFGFHIPFARSADAAADPLEINAWITIEPDDAVAIRVARSEMGQGVFTALPMLVAEELECDWAKVKAQYVSPSENLRRNRVWGSLSTGNSTSIKASQESLRRAGATVRELLIGAASARWGCSPSECRAANGVITHLPSGRTAGFG